MPSASVVGIIPARFASTRLPGKLLATIGGKTLIQHVYERAVQAKSLDKVIIATDDQRIARVAAIFGAEVRMTRSDHQSGSDRVGEVAESLSAEYIVNIQGDEPFLPPTAIDSAVAKLIAAPGGVVATLVKPCTEGTQLLNPNKVRVVLDQNDNALYFSRAAIPFNRDTPEVAQWPCAATYFEHVGLYVFRRAFLMEFVSWPPGVLERVEKLEQLRILERGYRIICARTGYQPVCVDTPADLEYARQIWKEHTLAN